MNKRALAVAIVTALLSGCQKSGHEEFKMESSLEESDVIDIASQEETVEEEIVTEIISKDYETVAKSIDAYLQEQLFNGVALVSTGDDLILVKGYGLANVENHEPMTIDKKFQIASVSKSFVAVSILQLVESGQLTLEQTIDTYFPTLPHGEEITIHQLLTHTSALYSGDDLTNYNQATTLDQVIADAFKENNLYYEEPGVYAIYSNLGYDLLGAIIEQITRMSYADYVRLNILEPCEMTDSGLNMDAVPLDNMATAYNGNIAEGYNAKILNPSFGYASGGLHSTVMDLFKYDRALAKNELISEESFKMMSTPYSKIGNKDYGYGWYVDMYLENTISHPGNLIGWHSMLLHHKEDKVSVILLTNHDESDMNMAFTIARLVLTNLESE